MQSLKKDGMDSGTTFFQALRRLGRKIDQGVKDLQEQQLDNRQLACESSRHVALKGLVDRRKEVDSLKLNSRTLVNQMRERGKTFEQSLEACSELIDLQQQQLSTIQSHLMQYGFVPQPDECNDHAEAEDGAQATGPEKDTEPPPTPPQDTGSKDEVKEKMKLTPCLEDFGVSSYTLNMLNQPAQAAPSFRASAVVPPGIQTRNEATRHELVPEMFRNEGLTVTPSLFPKSSGIEDRSALAGKFSLAYSPDVMNKGCVDPFEVDADLQDRPEEVAKTLDFSDSPVPPVLRTPGIKQISRVGETVRPHALRERGCSALQLKLGDSQAAVADTEAVDSPVPPVLATPGIQQISSRALVAHKTSQAPATVGNPLELPRTPELTYSLKDLEDLTVSFRQTDLSSTFSERSATTNSDLDMSASTQLAGVHQGPPKGRGPPPPPAVASKECRQVSSPKLSSCTTDHMAAGLVVSEPQLSTWSRGGAGTEGLDLPPSPELTMSYTTLCRAVTTAPTLSSTTVPSHRHTTQGQGHTTQSYEHTMQNHPHTALSRHDMENWRQGDQNFGGKRPTLTADLSVHYSQTRVPHNTRSEQYQKGSGLLDESYVPSTRSGFVPACSSNTESCMSDLHRQVLQSAENRKSPIRPEGGRKVEPVVKGPALPDQPLLRHPLTDGSLDMPATPKFLGSYDFMGSKH